MKEMKKYIAVLLVALIIGVTPAAGVKFEEMTQAVDMTVRGKGADVAASQINETFNTTVEQNSSVEQKNTAVELNTAGNDNSSVPASDEATESVDMQVPDLNDSSLENYTVNVTVPQIDTSGIVMQSTDYSCGPAALATVLQNIGISVTEQELKVLAETNNETGTSMYGLVRAAKAKGVNATGMRLSVADLRPNMIVHVIKDGEGHYSVVRDVRVCRTSFRVSVLLADPSLGNIEMCGEKFNEIFTGNVLVINGSLNQTAEQANSSAQNLTTEEQAISTDTVSVQAENSQTLTTEMMQDIRGKGWWEAIKRAATDAWNWLSSAAANLQRNPIFSITFTDQGNHSSWGNNSTHSWGNNSSHNRTFNVAFGARRTTRRRGR